MGDLTCAPVSDNVVFSAVSWRAPARSQYRRGVKTGAEDGHSLISVLRDVGYGVRGKRYM